VVSPLIWQILIPLLTSSLVVILVTIVAERHGTKIGGILGTLPSTIVVAFIFISLNQNAKFASLAAMIVPAEMGINILFLLIFISVIPHGFLRALVASLGVWCLCSLVLYVSPVHSIFSSCLIYAILMTCIFIFIEKIKKIKSRGKVSITYTPKKILIRGLFAGIMITIAVVMANINEILSGVFSVFPAIFLSTMIICVKEHGPQFTNALGKSMIFGTPTVVSYAIAIHFLYPILPLYGGTVLAYTISLLVVGILFYVKKKIL
jgi:hypothetical protein